MRKLVTVRTIDALTAIQGADRIEVATVDGWNVIVKKGEFVEGGLGLFFEIDSFLPVEPRYEFLGKTKEHQGKTGYRIKTMKMRGTISQGLMLPLELFPEVTEATDYDFSEVLKVTKYDVAVGKKGQPNMEGRTNSSFPSFIPKTDQNRIQNLMSYFNIHKDMNFEVTLKLDGSSCTMYKMARDFKWYEKLFQKLGFKYNNYEFGVCSRNVNLKDGDNNFWNVARKYNIEETLPIGYAIQGELVAPNIQNNHEKVSGAEYYVFDVRNINENRYLLPDERHEFMAYFIPQAKHAPILHTGQKLFEEHTELDKLLESVEGQSMNPQTISEGRVYKSTTKENITFKAISNKYLLKCEE